MMPPPSRPVEALSDTPYHFGFVLQQVLGWVGGTQALKRFVAADPSVVATWNEVTFVREGGWSERLPLPAGLRGTLRGALQTRQGLGARALPLRPWTRATPATPATRATPATPASYDALLFTSPSLCRVA